MTKQEQIEEMAKAIKPILENRTDICFIPDLDKPIAKELLKHYQPKLPKDSVVLSKGAYESLSTKANVVNAIEIRKKTAEEILNAVVGAIDNGTFFRKNFIFMMNNVYGVEVQNANNDKTIEQANKKIVRQFYNKIQKMLDETRQVIEEPCNGRQNAGYCVADVDNGLKELAKQFGVEIKE